MSNTVLKLPEKYESLPTATLERIKASMERRIDNIEEQLRLVQRMPGQSPEGFGGKDWRIKAKDAKNRYIHDIRSIKCELKIRRTTGNIGDNTRWQFSGNARIETKKKFRSKDCCTGRNS